MTQQGLKHLRFALAGALSFTVLASFSAKGDVPLCPYQFEVEDGYKIPYCRNYSLDDREERIKRVVIAIHGAERQAMVTHDSVLDAARRAGQDVTTLIIAPQFLNNQDTDIPDDVLYWTGAFWRMGNPSVNGPRVSSYRVVDLLLRQIVDGGKFPNVEMVIVSGHSAGGQFAQRFAAGSQVENYISGERGIPMRYVVMNPGSWLYFDPARWNPDKAAFTVPDTDCAYDDYGFGLHGPLNQYMRAVGVETIRDQYARRQVIYILGDQDICRADEAVCTTPPGSPPPDSGCAALFQGIHRFERGTIFYQYIQYYYLETYPDILSRHIQEIVLGVGHDGNAMYSSGSSLTWIFDQPPECE